MEPEVIESAVEEIERLLLELEDWRDDRVEVVSELADQLLNELRDIDLD